MADTTHSHAARLRRSRLEGAWASSALIVLAVAVLEPAFLGETLRSALSSLLHTAPFILFAVLAVSYLKASGAETLLARAFEGRAARMVVLAAMLGGLSPFCSCEVIPFIAALLAVGAPLGAVMAFWLASPQMDPAMFLITGGTLGFDFALAKTVAAVGIGLMGGFVTLALSDSPVFRAPLREQPKTGGCCGVKKPFSGAPVWAFWSDPARTTRFRETFTEQVLFLTKWLLLAYLIEAVMLRHVPAETIAGLLGGTGLWPIVLGALIGAPAYLNGYAAVPLVDALLSQGMAPGAAMSFVIAGGVSCIPAVVAVWALVKPRVFAAYLGFAVIGAILAGLGWAAVA